VVSVSPARRVIELTSLENGRDLGGLPTGDGRRVIPGVFVRSAALDVLTDVDRNALEQMGIVTALDVRSDMEREERPARWPSDRLVAVPLADDEEMVGVVARIMSGDILGAELETLWEANIATFATRFIPAIRRIFGVFAAAGPGRGVLFHCRGGKDRTGVVAMLLLEALGVVRSEVFDDFLFTNAQVGTEERAAAVAAEFSRITGTPVDPAEVFPFAGVRREWLEGAYAAIEERFGSVERYLAEVIGVDLTGFRGRFLAAG
jgi:protein-tyrosine phosphatase